MINADHAPWDEAKWFQSGKEAVDTYLKLAHYNDDPLFCDLFPLILNNLGLELDAGSAQAAAWRSIGEAWQTKNEKIAMTRWFGYVRTMRSFLTKWHSRLATVLYMCASQGMLKTLTPKALTTAMSVDDAGTEDSRKVCKLAVPAQF